MRGVLKKRENAYFLGEYCAFDENYRHPVNNRPSRRVQKRFIDQNKLKFHKILTIIQNSEA